MNKLTVKAVAGGLGLIIAAGGAWAVVAQVNPFVLHDDFILIAERATDARHRQVFRNILDIEDRLQKAKSPPRRRQLREMLEQERRRLKRLERDMEKYQRR